MRARRGSHVDMVHSHWAPHHPRRCDTDVPYDCPAGRTDGCGAGRSRHCARRCADAHPARAATEARLVKVCPQSRGTAREGERAFCHARSIRSARRCNVIGAPAACGERAQSARTSKARRGRAGNVCAVPCVALHGEVISRSTRSFEECPGAAFAFELIAHAPCACRTFRTRAAPAPRPPYASVAVARWRRRRRRRPRRARSAGPAPRFCYFFSGLSHHAK